jgi:hypothetical protein
VQLHLRGRAAAALALESESSARRALLRRAKRHAAAIARIDVTCTPHWAGTILAAVAAQEGRTGDALSLLRSAEAGFEEIEMPGYAESCRRRRGEILGGDEGRALVAEADERLRSRGVVNPSRWADAYLPRVSR